MSAAQLLLDRLAGGGVRLGLERIRPLLAALGEPQRGYPVVLVAGSNGKGSTAVLLASMAAAAGYRTGLFTSPELEEVRECVRLEGAALADDRLAELLERVVTAPAVELPSPFEALTAAAYLAFAEARVELAVVEVGMGGARDATNAADPLLSIITPISRDHEEHLGRGLAALVAEKAGVLRAGRPAILDAGSPRVAALLAGAAADAGALVRWSDGGTGGDARGRIALQLPGRHQAERNLPLAVLAAEELAGRGFGEIDGEAIAFGAERCRWPGRLEEVTPPRDRDGPRRVLLDAAHNPGGAAALAAHLGQPAGGHSGLGHGDLGHGGAFDLLFGTFRDKRAEEMLPPLLAAGCRRLVLTTAPGARGRPADELAALVAERALAPPAGVEVVDDPAAALAAALAGCPADRRLVVAGSLALVGRLRGELRRRWGRPAPAAAPLW